LDSYALAVLAELWAEYDALKAKCGQNMELRMKHRGEMSRLVRQYAVLANKFGMTPAARSKLKRQLPANGDTPHPLDKFLSKY